MKCRDLQFIIPLYSDNVLSAEELSLAEQHLDSCPVCRQKVIDLQEVRNGLRSISKPKFSLAATNELKRKVAEQLEASTGRQMFHNVGDRRRWVDVWLMPFAVGSLSTLLVGFTLLWVIVSNEIEPSFGRESVSASTSNTTMLYPLPSTLDLETELTPMEYANSRSAWSHESPSINPKGSLVALTQNLLSEVKENEELTVVADVYGNGSASITEVVEASSDRRAVGELERALGSDSATAAFVPASFDQRIEPMRVVLKIQSVSINTHLH